MRLLVCLEIAIILACCSLASARTWYVKPDGTGDVPSIKAAVDSAAAEGDTVLLANGTFAGAANRQVDCGDKALTIISEASDPDLCIIDCGGAEPADVLSAFYFRASGHPSPRLEAVTIIHACQAVYCDAGSSPQIVNCIFRDNHCAGAEIPPPGAGIFCFEGSSPVIRNCEFAGNESGGGICGWRSFPVVENCNFSGNGNCAGGAIEAWGGLLTVTGCTFSGNLAADFMCGNCGGGALMCVGSADVANCTFTDNRSYMGPGGAIFFRPDSAFAHLTVAGCTFVGNQVLQGLDVGVGVAASSNKASSITITNCTFAGNSTDVSRDGGTLSIDGGGDVNATVENTIISFARKGGAVHLLGTPTVSLKCCDIFGNTGGDWTGPIAGQNGINGNLSADPLFCDRGSDDLSLENCSPCLPGHHPAGYDCGEMIGARGVGCECNAAAVPTTWGAIKALFKD
ncbi:MAG TPA: right-handed parallel beta-helix repeat-containing protein [bacterium]|nr:right-handed parallel beta-helix repeat-containing protein [bacterium]